MFQVYSNAFAPTILCCIKENILKCSINCLSLIIILQKSLFYTFFFTLLFKLFTFYNNIYSQRNAHSTRFTLLLRRKLCDLLINFTKSAKIVTENYLLSLINSIDFCDVSNKFLKKRVHFTYKLLTH